MKFTIAALVTLMAVPAAAIELTPEVRTFKLDMSSILSEFTRSHLSK